MENARSTPIAFSHRICSHRPFLSRLYTKYTHKMRVYVCVFVCERVCVCIVFVNVDNKCRHYKNPYYLRSHNFHNQNHSQLILSAHSHLSGTTSLIYISNILHVHSVFVFLSLCRRFVHALLFDVCVCACMWTCLFLCVFTFRLSYTHRHTH